LSFPQFPNPDNFFILDFIDVDVGQTINSVDVSETLSLEKQLDTGWPWPLDSVQRFFEDLWSFISNIPSRIWSFFNDALKDAIPWLWYNIAYPLIQFSVDVYRIAYEWTYRWPEPWGSIARFLLFPSAFLYKAFRDYIAPTLSSAVNEVKMYFDGAVGGVFDAIRNAFSPIFDPLKRFADTVWSFITDTMPGFIKSSIDFFTDLPKKIEGFFSWLSRDFYNTFASIADFFTKTLPDSIKKFRDLLSNIPEALRTIFLENLPRMLLSAFSTIWGWINDNVVTPLRSALQNLWSTISDVFSSFLRSTVEYFTTLPDDFARGGAEAVIAKLLPLIGTGFGIALALDVASIKVMGSGVDLDATKRYINNLILKWFDASIFTSVFLAVAIQKPLEYVAQRLFRTNRPGAGDALKFLAKNIIDRGEAAEYLRIAGYPDTVVEKYLNSIFREPDFPSLFTAYRRGRISEEEYRAWLSILNVDVARTKDGVLYPYRVLEESMYRVPSPFILVSAVETGELSEEAVKRILEYELIHPQFVDIVSRALMWRSMRDERSLLRRYVIDLFSDGVLSTAEFESYLNVLGVNRDYMRSIAEVASLNREKNMRKKIVSQIEKAFLDGYIDRADFVEKAASLGYDRDLVNRYASLLEYIRDNYYVVKETRDERNTYRSTLVRRFKDGYINEDELRSELLKLNLNDIEIELTILRARLEYEAEQKEILFKDIIERLKTGKMSKSEFTDQCATLGIKYDRCLAYANYYWSKYIGDEYYNLTKDERNALASALLKKYVLGFMSEDELRSELMRLGFTAEEVELRIRRAVVEDDINRLIDIVKEADTLLKNQEISPRDYIDYLVSLGMRRERAEARASKILASIRKAR